MTAAAAAVEALCAYVAGVGVGVVCAVLVWAAFTTDRTK